MRMQNASSLFDVFRSIALCSVNGDILGTYNFVRNTFVYCRNDLSICDHFCVVVAPVNLKAI